jgi:NAD(P)-dependent dehydrogenase (short-subunit alcohol dehydrogenase family)
MDELRFDGRTAIVTGAGGNPSLGRVHALLLASRGANVVVNDIGRVPETTGYAGIASAEAVAQEIRDLGGKAVADTHSVAIEEEAEALIATALDAFGRLDVLVNNAAVCIMVPFDEMTSRDFRRHIEVNVMGPVWTCRAAWPHMKRQGYGRIVNICSGGFAGTRLLTAYGASKGGVFSLTRALAAEGEAFGVKANAVNPLAFTRMLASQQEESSLLYRETKAHFPAEMVAPAVAFLAHERCPVTGECIDAYGGQVQRTYIARTPGISDPALTIEALAARWDEVMAEAGSTVVVSGTTDVSQWDVKPYQPLVDSE